MWQVFCLSIVTLAAVNASFSEIGFDATESILEFLDLSDWWSVRMSHPSLNEALKLHVSRKFEDESILLNGYPIFKCSSAMVASVLNDLMLDKPGLRCALTDGDKLIHLQNPFNTQRMQQKSHSVSDFIDLSSVKSLPPIIGPKLLHHCNQNGQIGIPEGYTDYRLERRISECGRWLICEATDPSSDPCMIAFSTFTGNPELIVPLMYAPKYLDLSSDGRWALVSYEEDDASVCLIDMVTGEITGIPDSTLFNQCKWTGNTGRFQVSRCISGYELKV